MARPSMTPLITTVRGLIGDQGSTQTFTDDEIQAALDQRKRMYRYYQLEAVYEVLPGGNTQYREFVADGGQWEADAQLVDASYNVLAPETSEPAIGRWVFAEAVPSGVVMIVGNRYDVYGAAADLCDQWLAKVKLEFQFSRGTRSYHKEQKLQGILALQKELRRKQWVGHMEMVRTDIN